MRISKLLRGVVVLLLAGTSLPLHTFAGSQNDQVAETTRRKDKKERVFVTGSMIPQKVEVKAIGTATTSSVRVYKRSEIDRYGRFTTEGVLALDPSVQVRQSGAPGSH